jgi:hypothetical protein
MTPTIDDARTGDLLAALRRIRTAVDWAEIDDAMRCALGLAENPREREWVGTLLRDAIDERRQQGDLDD